MGRARRLVLFLGLALGACSQARPPAPAANADTEKPAPPPPSAGTLAQPPTIVLITIDTLRREHLGCYGYFRPTSPHIDALAAEGLLFERALASMASTLPSHLSMLTGLYPHQHGMNSNRRSASVPFTSELGRLSSAAVLEQCGYRTAAFVSAAPLSLTTGIQTGFQTYSFLGNAHHASSQRAAETNEFALAWLDQHAAEPGPFFLWVHYFDPHEPCDPPPPYERMFRSDAQQREWIRARGIDPARLSARFAHSARVRQHFLTGAPKKRRDEPLEVTLDGVADLMNRYDGEVRYADEAVGALLDSLRRHGRYADAIVVLAGDHGQSLGENDWFGHGSITNVNTFVPLIVRLPPGLVAQPGRVAALVSLTDLMPTVLARFELPGSELLRGQFEGEDVLSGAFERGNALTERTADVLKDGETGRQFALLSEHWKFIHRPAGKDELYDLSGAGEFVDVLAQHPDVGARLRASTLAILARRPALLSEEEDAQADAKLLQNLEELGYGGEADESASSDEGDGE